MSVLTKASFSMTRNIRKNVPLVTRVDDNAWSIRGQLPFPQGLYFIYNAFAGKPLADVYSHHFFLEKEVWPEQPSPRFHLTDETQSTVLVVKGMIHNKDVTTHLDNTMVLCRNPKDHSEFGIYNPTHVEESSMDHVLKLIQGGGIEPESNNASEKFSLHAAYGSAKGMRNHLTNSSSSSSSSPSGRGSGMFGADYQQQQQKKSPALGTAASTQKLFDAHKKMQLERRMEDDRKSGLRKRSDNPATMFDHIDDLPLPANGGNNENEDAEKKKLKEYEGMFEKKEKLPGMVDGDPRLYGDAPWRNLAYRDPEDQLPEEYRRAKDDEARKKLMEEHEKERKLRHEKEDALDSAAAAARNKVGTVKWIVVPTRQTWQALELWRTKFPDAVIYCSGNIPAHLTKEGVAHGAIAPSAFSMPSAFSPGTPTPAPPEGTESSSMMSSSGGHGAKSSLNKIKGSGEVKKYAGDWSKKQIDLTRTRLDFYENESFAGERREAAENVLQRARDWERRVEELMQEHEKEQQQQPLQQEEEEVDGSAQKGDDDDVGVVVSVAGTVGEGEAKAEGKSEKGSAVVVARHRRRCLQQRLPLFHEIFQLQSKLGSSYSPPDPVLTKIEAEEVAADTVKIPKSLEEISEILSDGRQYIAERDGFDHVPATPLDNVRVLPRDGSVLPLFDNAFQLLRVSGDPHCNEYLLYKPDTALLACTDLFHGSYTDFDPMNTWLVRVWFKFQRDGNFKDASILPAFRLNALKNLPGGGIKRVQKFVDELTRAVPMKTLVFAHGSGPLVAASDVFGSIAHSAASTDRIVQAGESEEERQTRLEKSKKATLVADAIRAQYGLVSLEEAAWYIEEMKGKLSHPVTQADVYALHNPPSSLAKTDIEDDVGERNH